MVDKNDAADAAQQPRAMLDAFEWKARFVPAVLALMPLLPLSAAFHGPLLNWLAALVGGIGVAAVAAMGLSYLASNMGTSYQSRLWPDWPLDSPSHRALRPDDPTRSEAQRQQLYAAIRRLTGLDLAGAASSGDEKDIDALIDDAMSRLRVTLSDDTGPLGRRVKLHLTDYDFARNFAGLWPIWMCASAVSLVGCWILYARAPAVLPWALAATAVFIAAGAIALWGLAPFVRHRADDYARSLHAAILGLADAAGPRGHEAT